MLWCIIHTYTEKETKCTLFTVIDLKLITSDMQRVALRYFVLCTSCVILENIRRQTTATCDWPSVAEKKYATLLPRDAHSAKCGAVFPSLQLGTVTLAGWRRVSVCLSAL